MRNSPFHQNRDTAEVCDQLEQSPCLRSFFLLIHKIRLHTRQRHLFVNVKPIIVVFYLCFVYSVLNQTVFETTQIVQAQIHSTIK